MQQYTYIIGLHIVKLDLKRLILHSIIQNQILQISKYLDQLHIKATGLKKLDSRAKKAILVGFGNNLYRLYDINLKRLIWARDVKILENQFYNFNSSKEADLQVNEESVFDLNQKADKKIVEQNQIVKQNQIVE